MSPALSIIIPTKDRRRDLEKLLASIAAASELTTICPEIIVSDNGSKDDTRCRVSVLARCFPCHMRFVEVARAGKSAAVNEAARSAKGEMLVFVDDDVVVDKEWLLRIASFFHDPEYQVGQGCILVQPPESEDPVIQRLMHRYRTIPYLNFSAEVKDLHSLNGANFFIRRDLLNQLGGFDERLGPGASGTSEDVELSRRIQRAGHRIGYVRQAIVYHGVDRRRLTEEYFNSIHRRQGRSRLIIKQRSTAHILYNLARVSIRHGFLMMSREERKFYRNKGRIQHYLGMLEAKRNGKR